MRVSAPLSVHICSEACDSPSYTLFFVLRRCERPVDANAAGPAAGHERGAGVCPCIGSFNPVCLSSGAVLIAGLLVSVREHDLARGESREAGAVEGHPHTA